MSLPRPPEADEAISPTPMINEEIASSSFCGRTPRNDTKKIPPLAKGARGITYLSSIGCGYGVSLEPNNDRRNEQRNPMTNNELIY